PRLERRARVGTGRGARVARPRADRRPPPDSHPTGLRGRLGRDRPHGTAVTRRVTLTLVALITACGRTEAREGTPVPASAGIPRAAPSSLGFDSTRLAGVVGYLRAEADSGAFPGAVLAVGRHGRLALLAPVGHFGVDDPRPVEAGTLYDLASLTKVVALTTACMLLVDAGQLELDAPIDRYVPAFRGAMKDRVTVRHLLTHSAGLLADLPLYDSTATRAAALAAVDSTTLVAPPGTTYRYSDLSAIVLMQAVERVTGEPFDRFLSRRVLGPLGMPATRFRPPASWRDRIAPTEHDTVFRHRWLRGEVHDESAARLGGVSGNAGLFADALDLSRLAAMLF